MKEKGVHHILEHGEWSSALWRFQGNSTSGETRMTQIEGAEPEHRSGEFQETGRRLSAAQTAQPRHLTLGDVQHFP